MNAWGCRKINLLEILDEMMTWSIDRAHIPTLLNVVIQQLLVKDTQYISALLLG